MTNQPTTQTNGHPAPMATPAPIQPASIELQFIYRGYPLNLTISDISGAALIDKLDAVIDRIEKRGGGPVQLTSPQQATGGEQASGIPVCKYHGPMKPSKKPGAFYCPSKMGDGSYCKETA